MDQGDAGLDPTAREQSQEAPMMARMRQVSIPMDEDLIWRIEYW